MALRPQARPDLKLHHWGHERLAGSMRRHCPERFARCYPLRAEAGSDSAAARERLAPYLSHLIELGRFVPLRGVWSEDRRERGDPPRGADDPDQRLELERSFVELNAPAQVKDEEAALNP